MITVRSLEPFGVAIALSAEAFSAARMPRTKAEVGRAVAEHGMVVLSGADSMTADEMVELMTVFGLPDGMIDFSGTPRDFADDGSAWAQHMVQMIQPLPTPPRGLGVHQRTANGLLHCT